MNISLPKLKYDYNALEPYFDERTMIIHHTKHHQTYVNNVNSILKNLTQYNHMTDYDIIKNINKLPKNVRLSLRNNLGGHINHSIFWTCLKLKTTLNENLKLVIEDNFGDITSFKQLFEKIALSHFGSGWIWLVKENNKLSIVSTINQDNPFMGKKISGVNGFPILCLDLWEHAYYLKYQNNRLNYIKAFWNVINWDEVYIRYNLI